MRLSFQEQLLAFKKEKIKTEKQNSEQKLPKNIKEKIRNLVNNDIKNIKEATIPYHFIHYGRAKKVYVTKEQQDLLSDGKLAIFVLNKAHLLISIETAEKIRLESSVYPIYLNKTNNEKEEDNIYAQFIVPDDLIW